MIDQFYARVEVECTAQAQNYAEPKRNIGIFNAAVSFQLIGNRNDLRQEQHRGDLNKACGDQGKDDDNCPQDGGGSKSHSLTKEGYNQSWKTTINHLFFILELGQNPERTHEVEHKVHRRGHQNR